MNLELATVYDIETFPNVFSLHMEMLNNTTSSTWEMSDYRDDRRELLQWFEWLSQNQTPMIGFYSTHFDYIVIHYIRNNPDCTVADIYQYASTIINSVNRYEHMIWERNRFAPQIDLFKLHHFDNPAKATSLKALQLVMEMESVVDMPVKIGTHLTEQQVNKLLIPYGGHDVKSTKLFAMHSMEAMQYRTSLIPQFGLDVMNWSDVKIGSKVLESRLGEDLCYDRTSGRRVKRQTHRDRIELGKIILPYVQFSRPEFQYVLDFMRQTTLTRPEFIEAGKSDKVRTKGVLTGLNATINDVVYKYGTGGMHASVNNRVFIATDEWFIRDIDVRGLYPDIAIQNRMAPAHLGERFVVEYRRLPEERKEWQKKKGKKCNEANTLKLGSNGVYGNSNNENSIFFDSQYTMSTTINGQLSISMLIEWLLTIPTITIIQANTDGITYQIHRDYEPTAAKYCREWEQLTKLTLEDADYTRMWIRDVSTYIAESPDGSLKLKGVYWTPDPLRRYESISEQQPPAWHKDFGNTVSIRAAVAAMVHGVPPDVFIRNHTHPYDFMLRARVRRSDKLLFNGQPVQQISRYYVSKDGGELVKVSPPAKGAILGSYKKAPKVSDALWAQVNAELAAAGRPNDWDARIHTKARTTHRMREGRFQPGYNVSLCNNASDFKFSNVNYEWYVKQAEELIVC